MPKPGFEGLGGRLNQKQPLRGELELHPNRWRFLRKCGGALRCFYVFNRMHWLRLQPGHPPRARRNRRFPARNVVNASIRVIDPDMSGPAPGVPQKKNTRPSMMMHRLFSSRGNFHLKHTYDCVFKQAL
jgi:hypothetical protein